MKEIQNILKAYEQTDFKARKAVLATVVKVSGSSYRNAGARMLILDNGRWVGSISGGCLEGDALRKAKKVMADQKPMLVTYDTMDDDNNTLGVGLGCNGIIDVLLEPVDPTHPLNAIEHLKTLREFKSIGAVALIHHSDNETVEKIGDRLLLLPDGKTDDQFYTGHLRDQLEVDIKKSLKEKRSQTKSYAVDGGKVEVLFELVEPAIELLIFGAGADAQPVVQMAKIMGWQVRVSDECIAHLAPVNFPQADEVIGCQRDYVRKEVAIGEYTAVILMSHNYHYDLEVLKQIVDCPAPYIGILGPKKRTDKLFKALDEAQVVIPQKTLDRIHTPIGLDIGAQNADEIAVAIISEVLAKFSGRSGGFLKYHKGPIHKRQGINDEVFKQVYLDSEDTESSQQIG